MNESIATTHRIDAKAAIWAAIVAGIVNFYGMTALFPWFAMARGWITIFSHVMYGAVLGLVYASITRRDAVRPGI
jgi:hypothetical protein